MIALSVRQPWANDIADGSKTIETRRWKTEYRGILLIVSSREPPIPPAGAAVAVAKLVDCRPMRPADRSTSNSQYEAGLFAWVLQDVRRVRPFPVRGRLGLFEVPVRLGPDGLPCAVFDPTSAARSVSGSPRRVNAAKKTFSSSSQTQGNKDSHGEADTGSK